MEHKDKKGRTRFRQLSLVMILTCGTWSMFNALQAAYWQFFMTDVLLISAATAGVCLIIATTFELISCFLVGPIIEWARLPWGKYRSWVILAPPIITICFLMMFTDYRLPEIAMSGLLVLGYCIAHIGVNAVTTVRNLVISISGKTPQDRSILSTKKGQGSSIGTFIFGLIGLNCILFFNGGDPNAPEGYQAATLMFGTFFVITHVILFRVFPRSDTKNLKEEERQLNHLSIRWMWKSLTSSPPFIAIVLADSIRYIARAIMLGIIVYYFQYVLNDISASAFFFSASGIIAMIGSFLAEALIHKISKRTLYLFGYIVMIICFVLMFIFGLSAVAFIILSATWYFGLSFVNAAQVGMYADGIDYAVYKQKSDCRAWLMSLTTIPPQIGNLGRAVFVGLGLAVIGYSAQVTPAPEVVLGIRVLACIIPAVLMAIGLFMLLKWFNLEDKELITIREELTALGLNKDLDNTETVDGSDIEYNPDGRNLDR